MPYAARDLPSIFSVTMQQAALAGGREVMAVYGTCFDVEQKGDGSPVSEADRRSEAVIVDSLMKHFPDVPIVAEEAVATGDAPPPSDRFFLIDPLDGTKEFIARNDEFTVNIALIEDGMPVAGVVLAPALKLIYAATRQGASKSEIDERGMGAKNWTSIRARRCAEPPVAVASRSHMTPETEAVLRHARVGECRAIGSSLKFCIVAEGEADFYPRLGPTMEWDIAAGDAVLRAAGGIVVELDGQPLRYGRADATGRRDLKSPPFLALGDADRVNSFLPGSAA